MSFRCMRVQFLAAMLAVIGLGEAAAADVKPCPTPTGKGDYRIVPTADLPCASDQPLLGVNFGVVGGGGGGNEFGGLTGEVQLPLGGLNLQLDGFLGRTGDDWMGQAAGHAFILQGEDGMFGAYGSWSGFRGFDIYRGGLETSLQLGVVSFEAVGGWQSEGKHNMFVDSRLGLDVTDSSKVFAGFAYDNGSLVKFGFEADMSSYMPATFFAESTVNADKDLTARMGLKFDLAGIGQSGLSNCAPAPRKFANHWWLPKSVSSGKGSGGAATQQCSSLPAAEILALGEASGLCPVGCACSYVLTGTYSGVDYSSCSANLGGAAACS